MGRGDVAGERGGATGREGTHRHSPVAPRGVLGLLYPVFLLGLGGRLGSGRQWTSWTAIDDLVDVYYRALLDPAMNGPVNAVSPQPVRNDEYTATLGRVLDRPTD